MLFGWPMGRGHDTLPSNYQGFHTIWITMADIMVEGYYIPGPGTCYRLIQQLCVDQRKCIIASRIQEGSLSKAGRMLVPSWRWVVRQTTNARKFRNATAARRRPWQRVNGPVYTHKLLYNISDIPRNLVSSPITDDGLRLGPLVNL